MDVPAVGPPTILVVDVVPVISGLFVTTDEVVEPVTVENVEVTLVELVVEVVEIAVLNPVTVVEVITAGSPAPMLVPCRAGTGMFPQTEVPAVTVMLDAVTHTVPLQYWRTVAESAELSGTHTLAVPVVTPEMATSKNFGLLRLNAPTPLLRAERVCGTIKTDALGVDPLIVTVSPVRLEVKDPPPLPSRVIVLLSAVTSLTQNSKTRELRCSTTQRLPEESKPKPSGKFIPFWVVACVLVVKSV